MWGTTGIYCRVIHASIMKGPVLGWGLGLGLLMFAVVSIPVCLLGPPMKPTS